MVEINFNPQPRRNAIDAISQGLSSGLNLGLGIQQLKQRQERLKLAEDTRKAQGQLTAIKKAEFIFDRVLGKDVSLKEKNAMLQNPGVKQILSEALGGVDFGSAGDVDEDDIPVFDQLKKEFAVVAKSKNKKQALDLFNSVRFPEIMNDVQSKEELNELLKIKKNLVSSLGIEDKKKTNTQFVGTFGNEGVVFNPADSSFSTVPLPGGRIDPKIPPTAPAKLQDDLLKTEELSRQFSIVEEKFNPKFTGGLDAFVGQIAQKTGVGANKNRASFLQSLETVRNTLLQLRSGAQINENEAKRLRAELPDENSSDADFKQKMENFRNTLDSILGAKRDVLKKGGFRGFGGGGNGRPRIIFIGQE